ncbi:hypothetical protein OZY43_07865 [Lactobacillus sp. ESL0785]|uniref:hypothetical protein n=1 Tax=Lactobacillus sp. ESL0785 TaxID=2983232 RepID=UPI0023F853BA|nr:hypothetical protein [Lactobacillus sp. ESL0785]WEV70841.1 hypothetical protein OZY43_07865 [Lactobacillus sp. ESL0785]
MTNKTNNDDLTYLVKTIIKNYSYPQDNELSLQEKQELVDKLKKLDQQSGHLSEIMRITHAFYEDRIAKQFKTMDINFSWVFEMLQHELVSATRLHALLLNLAQAEHFSANSVTKINHYFEETNDYGNNDNFVTMSSSDIIDAIRLAKAAHLHTINKAIDDKEEGIIPTGPRVVKQAKEETSKIIKLSDY